MLEINSTPTEQAPNLFDLSGNLKQDLRFIKIMMANLIEFSDASYNNKSEPNSRLKRIVLTMGHNGVLVYDQGKYSHYPALELEKPVVSMVGAGDSFTGGFIQGLLAGDDLERCVHKGQLCAVQTLYSSRNVSADINSELF